MEILQRHEYVETIDVMNVRKFYTQLERGKFNLLSPSKAAYVLLFKNCPLTYALVLGLTLSGGVYRAVTLSLHPLYHTLVGIGLYPFDHIVIGRNVLTPTEYDKYVLWEQFYHDK